MALDTSTFNSKTSYLHYIILLRMLVPTSGLRKSKKESKNQESIQSSTTPFPGYQMGKYQNRNKNHTQEPRGQQATARHQ